MLPSPLQGASWWLTDYKRINSKVIKILKLFILIVKSCTKTRTKRWVVYRDEVVFLCQSLPAVMPLSRPQASQQNQVLICLQKAKRVGPVLTSSGRVFHRLIFSVGKVLLLDATCQNSLANKVYSRPLLQVQMWWASSFVMRWLFRYPRHIPYRAVINNTLK